MFQDKKFKCNHIEKIKNCSLNSFHTSIVLSRNTMPWTMESSIEFIIQERINMLQRFSRNGNRSINKIKLVLASKCLFHWSSPSMIIWMIKNWFNNNKRSMGCMNIVNNARDLRWICNRRNSGICDTIMNDDFWVMIPSWNSLWRRRTIIERREKGEKLTNSNWLKWNNWNQVSYKLLFIACADPN